MKVYCIINRETGAIFESARGHHTFKTPNAATAAFNYVQYRDRRWRKGEAPCFKEQDVWVRKALNITPEVLTDG